MWQPRLKDVLPNKASPNPNNLIPITKKHTKKTYFPTTLIFCGIIFYYSSHRKESLNLSSSSSSSMPNRPRRVKQSKEINLITSIDNWRCLLAKKYRKESSLSSLFGANTFAEKQLIYIPNCETSLQTFATISFSEPSESDVF